VTAASRKSSIFLLSAAGCAVVLVALAQWLTASPAVTTGIQLGALVGAVTAAASFLAMDCVLHRSNFAFFTVFFVGMSARLLLVFSCGAVAMIVNGIDPAALLVTLVGIYGALSVLEPFLLTANAFGEDA
jgi:hypothetical protein